MRSFRANSMVSKARLQNCVENRSSLVETGELLNICSLFFESAELLLNNDHVDLLAEGM
jgi:hypothetical protein